MKIKLTSLCMYTEKILKANFSWTIEVWFIIYGSVTLLTKSVEIYKCQVQRMLSDLCFKITWIHFSDDFFARAREPISYLASFIWGMEDYSMVWVSSNAYILKKNIQQSSASERRKLEPYNLVSSIGISVSPKFIQMRILGWSLTSFTWGSNWLPYTY